MPQTKAIKDNRTFVKGLITEAEALTYPANSCVEIENLVLYKKNLISRRLGLDAESNFQLSDVTFDISTVGNKAYGTYEWRNVDDDASTNFLVVQIGSTLYFYDYASTPLSSGRKTYTVNLNTYAVAGVGDVSDTFVSTDVGNGALFVVGSKIDPFFIRYDRALDTFTTTKVTLRIRDMDGLNDGLALDAKPPTLSIQHKYNLFNQGWTATYGGTDNFINSYRSIDVGYPSNSQQWSVGKLDNGTVDLNIVKNTNFGTGQAPRGHYIVSAFNKDYSAVSGIAGLTPVVETRRPQAIAFYAGRVFWGSANGRIYYSQVLREDFSNVGSCFQEADPTSDEISDLIDTDGGVIVISQAAEFLGFVIKERSLIAVSTTGAWAVRGDNDGGFKATGYEVVNLSKIGCINGKTILEADGVPMYWSETGIMTIELGGSGEDKGKSLTQETIQTFYDQIPPASKANARGGFDLATNRVLWLYRDDEDTTFSSYAYNRVLIFDLRLGAFYTYRIAREDGTTPFVCDLFTTPNVNSSRIKEDVVVNGQEVLVSGQGVLSTVEVRNFDKTFMRFFIINPNGATSRFTFGDFKDEEFKDWRYKDDEGLDFVSYLITGYAVDDEVIRVRDVPCIYVYSKVTETGFVGNEAIGYELTKESSIKMQVRWEWTDSSTSNRWSREVQTYRPVIRFANVDDLTPHFGFPVSLSRNSIRGSGKSVQIKFSSESGKDMQLLGWAMIMTVNTND